MVRKVASNPHTQAAAGCRQVYRDERPKEVKIFNQNLEDFLAAAADEISYVLASYEHAIFTVFAK